LRRATALVVAALLMTLAACSGESNEPSAARAERRAERASRRNDPGCRFIVAADGRRQTKGPAELEYLTDAKIVSRPCFDRVTFTFDRGNNADVPPGYMVEYREEPLVKVGEEEIPNSTSGFPDARAVLYIEFTPAATTDGRNPGAFRDTYNGNLRLAFDSDAVHHTTIVEWVDQYPDVTPEIPTDNKVVWLIGLDEKRPFTVDAASQPPRVNVIIMK
jgi:hypothetical protein